MRLAFALLLVLAGCSTPSAAPSRSGAGPSSPDFGLPPVRAALVLPDGSDPIGLDWFVSELGRLSGQEVTALPEVRQQLQQCKQELTIRTPVPADEVYPFVEALLGQYGFFLAPLKDGERPVLGVHAAGGRLANLAFSRPIPVSLDRLGELDRHPALLCQVVVTFQNIDSRQLQTQLRQLLVDAGGVQQAVPCGDRSLLLQGMGMKVAGLVQLLREVDRANAAPVPSKPAAPGDKG